MRFVLLFASAITALVAGSTAAAAEATCQLLPIAEWSLRKDQYQPVVDGSINGQSVGVMLDTGSTSTLIVRPAALRLGLKLYSLTGQRYFGIGGETLVEGAYVDELKIGGAVRKDWPAYVAGEHGFRGDIAVLLGYDFFQQLDIEFDLSHDTIRLFQPKNCERAWLAYWSTDALMLPFEHGEKVLINVTINGKPILAMIDSGVGYSKLSFEGALALGISSQSPGVTAAGCTYGLGKERYESWIAAFDSFAIGDEVIRNPRIRFADMWLHNRYDATGSLTQRRLRDLPDLLLGSDFLRAHRVYVSNSQRKVYFSYVGGTVFPPAKGKPCSEIKD
jgi:clan AA aspartic protease (TIGR02281 family)